MTPTSVLVTLIFLLGDGRPARNADVRCVGVPIYAAGDDGQKLLDDGTSLIIDKRGAIILLVEPTTITCDAKSGLYYWKGAIALEKHGQVKTIWMDAY